MKKILTLIIALLTLPAHADGPGTPIWMEPPVIEPPAFSWTGAYAGGSVGTSTHMNSYTREWSETEYFREETPWELHEFWCNRGKANNNHSRFKCDITGLTHSPELSGIVVGNNPWNNARDQDVRYTSGYDGLWLGESESFAFTLPAYVEPVDRGKNFGSVSYEYSSGVDVAEWTETTQYSEDYTVFEDDVTYGVVAGYRYQFGTAPFVVGLEANAFTTEGNGDFFQIGAQGGLALDRLLTFFEVGQDHYAGGADLAFGDYGQYRVGFRSWEANDGSDSGQMIRATYAF